MLRTEDSAAFLSDGWRGDWLRHRTLFGVITLSQTPIAFQHAPPLTGFVDGVSSVASGARRCPRFATSAASVESSVLP